MEKCTLANSCLWSLTNEFYAHSGQKAWIKTEMEKIDAKAPPVPFYMTSNPLIAHRWAAIAYAYYLYTQNVRPGSPFYLFELGAGTARFAYLFIQRFLHLLKTGSHDPEKAHPIKIVLCDLSDQVIQHWSNSVLLAPYFKSGLLESAEVLIDDKFEKIVTSGGKEISRQNPLDGFGMFMGGYLLDTLKHDAFWVDPQSRGKLLFNVQLGEDNTPSNSALSKLMNAQITYERSEPEQMTNQEIASLCDHYQKKIKYDPSRTVGLDFSIPVDALSLTQKLKSFCTEGTLVLTGDQGFASFDELIDEKEITFGRHGTISLPVNYDAYRFIEAKRGSRVLMSQQARHKFVECVLLHNSSASTAGKGDSLPASALEGSPAHVLLQQSIQNILDDFDVENYWQLVEQLHYPNNQNITVSLDMLYLLLKLGKSDPINFFFWMPSIFEQLAGATKGQKRQWQVLLMDIANAFYLVEDSEVDLLLNAGASCLTAELHDAAITFLGKGTRLAATRAEFFFNLGLCYLQKHDKQNAALHFIQAEKIDANFSLEARGLLNPS